MSRKLTNNTNISLPMAVWLLKDDYDYNPDPKVISATTLLKPMRALVLGIQNKNMDTKLDIKDLIPSKMGTAVHDSLERAWKDPVNVANAFKTLNLGTVLPRLLINPEPHEIKDDSVCVYLENRSTRQLGTWTVSGKYDLILDGVLADYKSTSVWAIIFGSNASQYTKQGSIYRWLNPDKITADHMHIEYLFTDWSSSKAKQDPSYPQTRVESKKYPLMSLQATEDMISEILDNLTKFIGAPQSQLPQCTPEELWQKPAKYKYYKNKASTGRSTRNYDNYEEANQRFLADASVGRVDKVEGEIVRCKYCPVMAICTQAELAIGQGLLVL